MIKCKTYRLFICMKTSGCNRMIKTGTKDNNTTAFLFHRQTLLNLFNISQNCPLIKNKGDE